MSIIVENGDGVLHANSFVSVEETTDFFTARGFSQPDSFEQLLIQAADTLLFISFVGSKTYATSALPFPRVGVTNCEGVAYGENEIPVELKIAQIWLCRYITEGHVPGQVSTPAVKRTKEGVDSLVEEVEYAINTTNASGIVNSKPLGLEDFPFAFNLLKHMIKDDSNGAGSSYNGRVIRA